MKRNLRKTSSHALSSSALMAVIPVSSAGGDTCGQSAAPPLAPCPVGRSLHHASARGGRGVSARPAPVSSPRNAPPIFRRNFAALVYKRLSVSFGIRVSLDLFARATRGTVVKCYRTANETSPSSYHNSY